MKEAINFYLMFMQINENINIEISIELNWSAHQHDFIFDLIKKLSMQVRFLWQRMTKVWISFIIVQMKCPNWNLYLITQGVR